ncbi:hypothetical protein [Arthrobacter zhaoguopingii]|uniref:hypothetical protein n=1 Tax=Arthrobacter zhaoguopingii TaxID=2681491 RepID=UPI00135AC76A|nr:hypothetical protein [Arthrobacter zhaoguopingii]
MRLTNLNRLLYAAGLSAVLFASALPASAATQQPAPPVSQTATTESESTPPAEAPVPATTPAPATEPTAPAPEEPAVAPETAQPAPEPTVEQPTARTAPAENQLTSEVPSLDWNPLLEPGSNARIGEEFTGPEDLHHSGHSHDESSPEGSFGAAMAPRSGDIKVTLVTVKLAGKTTADVNAINMDAARASISNSSSYWKSMSNNRLSMTVAKEIRGFSSAARITDSYETIMAKVTSELKWAYNPYEALVIFVPHKDLNYQGSWGILGGGFTDGPVSGRVIMPYPAYATKNVVAHEFGHVLGLHHSNSLYCSNGRVDVGIVNRSITDGSCGSYEYGDTLDLMGFAQGHVPVINSFLWEFGGFGRGDEIRNTGTAGTAKRYTLKAWAGTESNRAVKFTDPISRETYYVELRLPVGRDANIAIGGNQGVKVIKKDVRGWNGNASLLLTPNSTWTGYYNTNHTWQPQQTFTTHSGTRVSVDSMTSTSAVVTISNPIATKLAAAASGASLGAAVGPITCGLYGGGCYQAFSGGNVYYTAATGAHAVTGSYFTAWGEAGWQAKIGYPTAGVKCGLYNGGCYQTFSAGTIYSTAATGTHAVRASYMNAWRDAGWQMKIGYPTAGVKCGLYNGGCYQTFSAGTIYSTAATGTHAVSGPYMNAWRDAGWQAKIGYPTAPVRCGLAGDACYQTFSAGTIYRTAATGTHAVRSTSMNAWRDAGWQAGIGYPTAPVRCGAPGEPCYQTFTGATIYSTPTTGTHAVRSTYMNAWRDAGWQHGIGYPTGALRCGAAGAPCYQTFAAGTIYSTAATGTHAVRSTYMNAWRDAGWQNGIGYPTAPVKCGLTSNACYQTFATGTIYSAPTTGTHAVRSTYMNAWREAGWQAKIGYPTAGVKCGLYGDGCYQSFTGGNIYAAPGTGAHAVTEPFREAWRLAGWQMKLGYPLQSAAAAKGYRKVEFQRGWITWTTTGTKTTYKTS